jgi:hypothetical protein
MDLKAGDFYRHAKTGGLYRLTCVARIELSLNTVVVYEALDGNRGFWVRPLVEFTDRFEHVPGGAA